MLRFGVSTNRLTHFKEQTMSSLFIEAESFQNLGGWVVDQQSMETMGSAYVINIGI